MRHWRQMFFPFLGIFRNIVPKKKKSSATPFEAESSLVISHGLHLAVLKLKFQKSACLANVSIFHTKSVFFTLPSFNAKIYVCHRKS